MRAVIQRVQSAGVSVEGLTVGQIGPGLLVLVGVAEGDSESDAESLAKKIIGMRVFPDDQDRMNRSVVEAGGEVLIVSQFTLLGDVRKGRRPSFTAAAPPDEAERLIGVIVDCVGQSVPVATGRFGARMKVDLINDGPVTLLVEVVDGKIV